jgi:hypothetical protein
MTSPRWRTIFRVIVVALVGALVVSQVIPYGHEHKNPPVTEEPSWDQPSTRALAARACFDCHSNETRWPWYSHLAPSSWLVQAHVNDGRHVLNFSQWSMSYEEAHEASEAILAGTMPPRSYLLLHPEARLLPAERNQLVRGLDATLGTIRFGDEDD